MSMNSHAVPSSRRLLRAMIEGSMPYDATRARRAAVHMTGGEEHAFDRSRALSELGDQMAALAYANDTDQAAALLKIFRQNAKLALAALDGQSVRERP